MKDLIVTNATVNEIVRLHRAKGTDIAREDLDHIQIEDSKSFLSRLVSFFSGKPDLDRQRATKEFRDMMFYCMVKENKMKENAL